MKLVETTISATLVRMRYTDNSENATQWIDFQVPLDDNTEGQALGELRLKALRHAQSVIDAEIARLEGLAGRKP